MGGSARNEWIPILCSFLLGAVGLSSGACQTGEVNCWLINCTPEALKNVVSFLTEYFKSTYNLRSFSEGYKALFARKGRAQKNAFVTCNT